MRKKCIAFRRGKIITDVLYKGSCKCRCYEKAKKYWKSLSSEERSKFELIKGDWDKVYDEVYMMDEENDYDGIKAWDVVLGYRQKLISKLRVKNKRTWRRLKRLI